jgi:hypothetical protein
MIGYYLSPITLTDRAGRKTQSAAIRQLVSRASTIRRCRVISSIPVNPATGLATTTWCLCEVTGTDFTILDQDSRFEFLGLSTDLRSPVPPLFGDRLIKFGVDPLTVSGASSLAVALKQIGRLLNPALVRVGA